MRIEGGEVGGGGGGVDGVECVVWGSGCVACFLEWSSAVLNLRLRQAECAVGDGRLDEACELLEAEGVREHRKGQRLVGQLVEKLLSRGKAHLEVGRLGAARQDCEKAGRLGGNQEAVGELRAAVVLAGEALERSKRRAGAAIAEARGCLDRGEFSKGAGAIEGVEEGRGVGAAIEAGRAKRDGGAARAKGAMERGDWDGAAGALVGIEKLVDEELVEEVKAGLVGLVWEDLKRGRLDRVGARLDRLAGLGLERVKLEELDGVLDDCRLAGWLVESGDLGAAGVALGRLGLRLEGAKWLEEAKRLAKEAEAAKAGLMGGALGLLGGNGKEKSAKKMGRGRVGGGAGDGEVVERMVGGSVEMGRGDKGEHGMAGRFLLQVDGGGRCLVCRGGRVTMGAGKRFDVGLVGGGSSVGDVGGVVIERVEDDWFLRSPGVGQLAGEQTVGVVKVNGRVVGDCLLGDGDRIDVVGCGEMKFGLPVASSPTAVLRLTGAKLLGRRDVRRVVLMAGAVVIGAGGANHVKTDLVEGKVVVREDGERLRCGLMGGRDGGGEGQVLVEGETIEVGGVGVMKLGWSNPGV